MRKNIESVQFMIIRIAVRLVTIILIGITTGCNSSEELVDDLHFKEAKLRILAIGSSFARNATLYIPEVISDTYDNEEIEFCKVIKGGTSLEGYWSNFTSQSEEFQFARAVDGKWVDNGLINLQDALNYAKWDIVVIQQLSGLAGIPESFEPYISQLTNKIRKTCPNGLIGWQMTWSYSNHSQHPDFRLYNNNSDQMLREIRATLSQVKPHVDIIVPSGEMINLLRQTKFNTPMDLTVDGYHLTEGLPCFALSCLWHETLIKPFSGISCIRTSLGDSGSTLLTNEEKEIVISLLNELTK